ncbi:LysR family transcriptional regulator [Celerinatantimonas yamalensis]|uniref:LysR family transcriptional regulator n=1 Tax=Celerinatantimonas yamalensis TaxID=559956 RepID=A0ABW9G4K4_9GAMM
MELRQLRYFVAIAQAGTMTLAASQLNIAQPALSRSIKKLEDELGSLLLIRHERGIRLTESGQQLLGNARQILAQADDAKNAVAGIEQLQRGQVRIGLPAMLGSYFFPPLLMAFRARYPGLSIEVVDAGTVSIRQMLQQGTLDLGVVVKEDGLAGLASEPLLKEEMVCCMAQGHPLTHNAAISAEQFLNYQQIGFHSGYFHQRFIEHMGQHTLRAPNKVITTNLIPLIKAVVSQGEAIAMLLKLVIQTNDGIIIRSFAPAEYIHLHIAWHPERYLSHANQAFRQFLIEQLSTPYTSTERDLLTQ